MLYWIHWILSIPLKTSMKTLYLLQGDMTLSV